MLAPQAVTFAVALSGQKLPAGQPVQAMLPVAVQKVETYWPVAQVPHEEQEPALDAVEYEVPATHAVHTASVETVHRLLR